MASSRDTLDQDKRSSLRVEPVAVASLPDDDPPQVDLPQATDATPSTASTMKVEDIRASEASLSPPDSPARQTVEMRVSD